MTITFTANIATFGPVQVTADYEPPIIQPPFNVPARVEIQRVERLNPDVSRLLNSSQLDELTALATAEACPAFEDCRRCADCERMLGQNEVRRCSTCAGRMARV